MTEPRRRGRPATGETPKRYIRAGAIWDEAIKLAKERGETVTALVIRAIEREVRRLRREPGGGVSSYSAPGEVHGDQDHRQ